MLPDPYPIPPWTAPCRGTVSLPGSKSLTNRALVLSALQNGRSCLKGALFSRDSRLLIENLRALGLTVRTDEEAGFIEIEGTAGVLPVAEADLFVGNAGTAARFLTALLALHPDGRFHLDGDEEMRERPMGGLLDALAQLGTKFHFHRRKGCFPFDMRTSGLPGGVWNIDSRASSQMLSALLMVAPLADSTVEINPVGARPTFVNMTVSLMKQFGVGLEGNPDEGFRIPAGQSYRLARGELVIEPDASAASYFLALPLVVGGSLMVEGMSSTLLQGDTAFAGVLQCLGLQIEETGVGWAVSDPGNRPTEPQSFSFEHFSDTFLTLAAVAPLLSVPVTITGIGHTRFQETDRIHAMASELTRLGADVDSGPDFLRVSPFSTGLKLSGKPITVQTYRDHRVAMSFAILGCANRMESATPWVQIADPACCSKTFPAFFDKLNFLYQNCHD